jgi:glycosyltransferase involved in cell wall biosynthesis
MMKIAVLVPGFSTHAGDWAIPALEEFVRGLGTSADVHVFALRWPPIARRYPVYRASVHALGGGHRLGWRAAQLWLRALRAIVAEHRRAPFQVVHGFWADEPGWLAVWAARRLGVPAVLSLQGGELVAWPDIDYGLQRLPGRRALVRWALAHATVVTAGSAYHARQAVRFLPSIADRVVQLHTGVDTRRFRPATRVGGPAISVLNVGSLVPVKQQELLLRTLTRLPKASAAIAGDGPRAAALAALAAALGLSGRVDFLGRVPYDAMPDLYRRAAVYVQTSRHEGQAVASVEAAACGLAVVGTPVGVVPEIGLVAPDEQTLADTVGALLADPIRRAALGGQARAAVEAGFSLDACVARFLELYGSLNSAACGPSAVSRGLV